MLDGAHVVIYSRDAAADRDFFRTVLKLDHVDAHAGWLIFRMPPAELAVHPAEANDRHELFLMSDDLDADIAALRAAHVDCETVAQQAWGRVTRLTLPGGGKLGLYQPRHVRP